MGIVEWYNYHMTEGADPRTTDWLLISSPAPILIIMFCYLYFVLRCGPRFMEKRPAYNLRTFTKTYNIFQIIANAVVVQQIVSTGWLQENGFYCVSAGFLTDEISMRIPKIMWWVLLLKLIDFIETAIFVLRKKQRQITFLHLYHHVSTAGLSWVIVKYFAIGQATIFVIVNCAVHVIMYSYYYLSACGPKIQELIKPLKRFVTIIQLVQFVILILYTLQAYWPGCTNNTVWPTIMIANLLINFYLFYNFYQRTYTISKKDK